MTRLLIPVLVSLLLVACGKSSSSSSNQCIADWPAAGEPFTPAAPLAGVEPRILWRKRLTGAVTNDWILVNDERVALTAGGRLYLLDHDGNYLGGRTSAAFEGVTSAVADRDGNYYFVGWNVYSTDADGNLRWLVPLAEVTGDAPRARGRLVLGPDGGLFFGDSDGYLYAVESRDGQRRWRRRIAGDGEGAPVVLGGAGNAVLAIARAPAGQAEGQAEVRPQLWRASDGEPLASFDGPGGERYGAMFGRTLGIVTQRMEDRGGSYPWMHISALDTCAEERWTLTPRRAQWPALIGPGDQLYVVEREDEEGSPTFVSLYGPDGKRAAGPAPMPPPWGIGADGTIYALACDKPGHDGPSRLHAFGPDLEERWVLPLGDSCPAAGPVIDAQGQLYFTWYIDNATEVVAVQTGSPGLAPTSWPTRRHDARGTGWLD